MRKTMIVSVLLVELAAASCELRPEAAPEGQGTVALGRGAGRSVVNQPIGPVPGPGDVAPVANPFKGDRTALMEGRQLFVRYNCSGCHGGRAGGGMGPSLRDEIWIYGSTPDRIFNAIAQGRAHGMPSWGARLPEKQIWELTAYVQSLRTPDEPEAPR